MRSSTAATAGRTRSRYQQLMAIPPTTVSTPKAIATSHTMRLRPDLAATAIDRDIGQPLSFGQSLAECLAQIGHPVQIDDATLVDPFQDLVDAKALLAERFEQREQGGAIHAEQVDAGRRWIGDHKRVSIAGSGCPCPRHGRVPARTVILGTRFGACVQLRVHARDDPRDIHLGLGWDSRRPRLRLL